LGEPILCKVNDELSTPVEKKALKAGISKTSKDKVVVTDLVPGPLISEWKMPYPKVRRRMNTWKVFAKNLKPVKNCEILNGCRKTSYGPSFLCRVDLACESGSNPGTP